MNRSIFGTYWMIWSQQNPIASFGNTVVGFTVLKLTPLLVEYAANQLLAANTTLLAFTPPVGSAIRLPEVTPSPRFARKITVPARAARAPFAGWSPVLSGVGVPGAKEPAGTVQREPLTPSSSNRGFWGGNGAPLTVCGAVATVCTGVSPGPGGGRITLPRTTKRRACLAFRRDLYVPRI